MSKPKNKNQKQKKTKHVYIFLGLLILSFLFYGNSLKNQYSLDDHYVIVNKESIKKGILGIPKIFSSYYINSPLETHSYRPITSSSFAIEYQFFGTNPMISHFINILLYALCCFLIFRLVLHLKNGNHTFYIGCLAALIFLILPVHSEVVNNIKSRDELLCFTFGILSLIYFLKYATNKHKKNIGFGIVFYLLSILSKTTSMTLIALIPFTLVYFERLKIKSLLVFVPLISLIFLSHKVVKKLLLPKEENSRVYEKLENPLFVDSYSFFDRIPIGISNVGDYLQLIFYPNKLICYYGFDQATLSEWTNAKVWLSFLIILMAFTLIVFSWKKNRLVAFGLTWFFVSISMFTNIIKPVVGIIGERFCFLPSLGIVIALASILYSFSKSGYFSNKKIKFSFYITCGLIFGLSWNKVVKRNTAWYDKETLYRTDVKQAPRSVKLNNLLANLIFRKIQKEPPPTQRKKLVIEAISLYKKSIEIHPEYANSLNNLGTLILNEKQDPKLALSYFERAVKHKKDYKEALFGAGYACEVLNNKVRALKYYKDVAALDNSFQNIQTRIYSVSN